MPGDPFVFLDRDGTLVHDEGYTHRVEDYALLPGVAAALRRLLAAGYRLAIVTNQSGIARGYFGEQDFARFQDHLIQDLESASVTITATLHCPHHPDAGCGCRKPAAGLLWRARDELGADLERSWVIGDSWRDVGLAHAAGCRGAVLVEGPANDPAHPLPPCHRAADLASAVDVILAADSAATQP